MLVPLCLVLAAAPPLPKECEQPPLREVAPIKELTNLDGAFSAGLDAVATWCFDSAGVWNGGVLAKPGKKGPGPQLPVADPPAQGDCLKAITSCEGTFETVKNKAPLRELAAAALADFERVYRGQKYTPKRSGLKEAPSEAANCRSRSRTELFTMAQQRMDIARLNSQVLNEYANYKTWLFARGLECRNEIAAGPKKDPTKVGVSIDTAPPPEPALKPKDPETQAALKLPMAEKWKYFSKLQSRVEADRDFTLGFLASKELRGCDCTRVNPAAVVRALEKKEGGEAGVGLLTADDPANTRCAVCMFEVFPLWSARAQKTCASLGALSDADLLKLEKSDDVNGVPPRCLEETKTARAAAKAAADAKAVADAKAAADAKALAAAKPNEQVRVPVGRDGGTLVALAAVTTPTTTTATGVTGSPVTPATGGTPARPGTPTGTAGTPVTGTAATTPAGPTPTGTTTTGTTAPATGGTAAKPGTPAGTAGTTATGTTATGTTATGTTEANSANPNLQTVDGYTYYRPQPASPNPANTANPANPPTGNTATPAVGGSPATKPAGTTAAGTPPTPTTTAPVATGTTAGTAPANPTANAPTAAPTGPGMPTGPNSYVPPSDWAPIPQREDGRIYVRLFMSSACVAEVEPGPLQARTGDLLLLPFEAHALQVKSPCGGLAEVYFGREARPRVSENFGRNTPLKFEFKRQ